MSYRLLKLGPHLDDLHLYGRHLYRAAVESILFFSWGFLLQAYPPREKQNAQKAEPFVVVLNWAVSGEGGGKGILWVNLGREKKTARRPVCVKD